FFLIIRTHSKFVYSWIVNEAGMGYTNVVITKPFKLFTAVGVAFEFCIDFPFLVFIYQVHPPPFNDPIEIHSLSLLFSENTTEPPAIIINPLDSSKDPIP